MKMVQAFNKFIDKIENTKRRETIKDLIKRLSELMYDLRRVR